MGVLSESVVASFEVETEARRGFSVTGLHPCPYGTYINYHNLAPRDFNASSRMLMDDGHWQERKVIHYLRRAGFGLKHVEPEQMTVHVGKARVPGHPDGLIEVTSKEDMLEVKAMSLNRFTLHRQSGVDAFPGYKVQIHSYMSSEELRGKVDGCHFLTMHKDSCRPYDFFYPVNFSYIDPIIEAMDEIILGGWIPDKELNPLCGKCGHAQFCWGTWILDLSRMDVKSESESVEKWGQGRMYKDLGKYLNEEAREELITSLGDKDLLFADGETLNVEVKRSTKQTFKISREKFVETFGASRLPEVLEEETSEQIRIREV